VECPQNADARVGVDDYLNFSINSDVSIEITCSKCHQLTDHLETSQMELKFLQLALKDQDF
jgi:hypothetical protein